VEQRHLKEYLKAIQMDSIIFSARKHELVTPWLFFAPKPLGHTNRGEYEIAPLESPFVAQKLETHIGYAKAALPLI